MNADNGTAMSDHLNPEKDLFAEALELSGEERKEFLKSSCKDNPELLKRIHVHTSAARALASGREFRQRRSGGDLAKSPPPCRHIGTSHGGV